MTSYAFVLSWTYFFSQNILMLLFVSEGQCNNCKHPNAFCKFQSTVYSLHVQRPRQAFHKTSAPVPAKDNPRRFSTIKREQKEKERERRREQKLDDTERKQHFYNSYSSSPLLKRKSVFVPGNCFPEILHLFIILYNY